MDVINENQVSLEDAEDTSKIQDNLNEESSDERHNHQANDQVLTNKAKNYETLEIGDKNEPKVDDTANLNKSEDKKRPGRLSRKGKKADKKDDKNVEVAITNVEDVSLSDKKMVRGSGARKPDETAKVRTTCSMDKDEVIPTFFFFSCVS